ncbi:SDR family oxidoreductase [Balneolales bacterium ANBcel1]|nr:SDR family oxidoreductase [Balneolales bacterium ANBcel1]
MKILLTGVTGYIGKRLLPVLVENGHQVICCVRDRNRLSLNPDLRDQVEVVEADFLNPESLSAVPQDIEAAYYLIHSMSSRSGNFQDLEQQAARNFRDCMNRTSVRHVIYLSGIINDRNLSRHLASRKQVEDIISDGNYPATTLRAGIIIGSGSASFEIIRDLVEKLPVMIAPRWLKTLSQPIAVRDVLRFLEKTLCDERTFHANFDIGGPDVLTYRQMLEQYAEVRGLRRLIISVPVLSPQLSSYWLYFMTSTSYSLAVKLVDSMKVDVTCRDNRLAEMLDITPISYRKAVSLAFRKIDQNAILSSWKDSLISGRLSSRLSQHVQVPTEGCFKDRKERRINRPDVVLSRIWHIGGETGWYYADWLWHFRGFFDKLFGGVGLRRGRTSPTDIKAGDTLDFWRVLLADREQQRMLLYAEMRLPGEAWLEFRITGDTLIQEATFRPKGLWGRLYWYLVLPFHYFIFNGMIKRLTE